MDIETAWIIFQICYDIELAMSVINFIKLI